MKKLFILLVLICLPVNAEYLNIKGGIVVDSKEISIIEYRDLDLFETTGNLYIHLKNGRVKKVQDLINKKLLHS